MRYVVVAGVKRFGPIERFDVHVDANSKSRNYIECQAAKIECGRRPAGTLGKAPTGSPLGAQDVRGKQPGNGHKHDGSEHACSIAGNADGAIGNAQEANEGH